MPVFFFLNILIHSICMGLYGGDRTMASYIKSKDALMLKLDRDRRGGLTIKEMAYKHSITEEEVVHLLDEFDYHRRHK